MENNIRELRIEKAWTQQRLCKEVNMPGFDRSLLSKLENGLIAPTPELEASLCRALQVQPVHLYGKWVQLDLNLPKAHTERPEPSFELEELWATLRRGHRNATDRKELAYEMDMTDRRVRDLIAKSAQFGVFIGNTGTGYFIIETEDEFRRYYRQEMSRAVSTFRKVQSMKSYAHKKGYAL